MYNYLIHYDIFESRNQLFESVEIVGLIIMSVFCVGVKNILTSHIICWLVKETVNILGIGYDYCHLFFFRCNITLSER